MRGHPDEIEQALTTLSDTVAEELSAAGWQKRMLHGYRSNSTLTCSMHNGVIAALEIDRTSSQWPDDWPVEIQAWLGVGYDPALNLMPLLTLPARAALVRDREPGSARLTAELTGLGNVSDVAQRIVHFTGQHASSTARKFPDAMAIDTQLQRDISAAQTWAAEHPEEDEDLSAPDPRTQLRLLLLAAMGRHSEARALLAAYTAEPNGAALDRDDRRFIRQLGRWLDAGGPVAPPVEETLALLPRPVRRPRTSWSDSRAQSTARREALDAVRPQAKGKNMKELKDLITAEFSARGIQISPSAVDTSAELLHAEQQPFGRARNSYKVIGMFTSVVGDIIHQIRHGSGDDPEWLQPPKRATYRMVAEPKQYIAIDINAAARDWLEHVRTEAPRRLGRWVMIDVWLSQGAADGSIEAHIGEQLVGMVPRSHVDTFDEVMRAAALFDEDPFVEGRLTRAAGGGAATLEIPAPQHAGATDAEI